MTVELWTLIAVEVGALASLALPVIIASGAHWWSNFIGRYLMYQSVGFALILTYAGYGRLALRFGWSPLPQSRLVLLSIFALIASIKVFGMVTFLRIRFLSRRAVRAEKRLASVDQQ